MSTQPGDIYKSKFSEYVTSPIKMVIKIPFITILEIAEELLWEGKIYVK